jgi:hypothetical protein
MVNEKKLFENLISMGKSKEEATEITKSFSPLFKFNEYLKDKYDLKTDEEVEKMASLFMQTKETYMSDEIDKVTTLIDESETDKEDLELIATKMTEVMARVSGEAMIEFGNIHEYPKSKELKTSINKYINIVIKDAIKAEISKNV